MTRPYPVRWESLNHHDEPRDQQADLIGGMWGEVGPDHPDKWSWAVLRTDDDGSYVIESGITDTEHEAKRIALLTAQGYHNVNTIDATESR